MSKSRRPSPALAVSVAALFVALGSSAYAIKKVGTKEIRNGAVTTKKLRKGAVKKARIARNAVTGAKVREQTLGTVPNADRVGGVHLRPVFERVDAGMNAHLLTLGGMQLAVDCDVTSDAGLRLSFGPPGTAYRLVRLPDAGGGVVVARAPNRDSGSLVIGTNDLILLTAASGGRTLGAQIQTWDAGQDALGGDSCLFTGMIQTQGA